MSSNLAIKLRSGTQQAHTAAENVGFMKCFLQGVVNQGCFAQFLANLYYIYSELEAAIERHKEHSVIREIYFPQLYRQKFLIQDMVFYYGNEWHRQITPSPVTRNYIARIQEISTHRPILLVGHAYTRYMGDLSGGQMLQKIAQSALKLNQYEGTSFYNFEQIPDKKAFKEQYRQILDALPIDTATAEMIVQEANYAFQFNLQMAQELEEGLIKAIGDVLFHRLTNSEQPGSTEVATTN
jgi:heme oxygenase